MNVRALFFGPLVDVTGASTLELTLPGAPTVHMLLEELFQRWPALRDWEPNLLVAVNLAYSGREDPIPPGSEIAIMPPVQGG